MRQSRRNASYHATVWPLEKAPYEPSHLIRGARDTANRVADHHYDSIKIWYKRCNVRARGLRIIYIAQAATELHIKAGAWADIVEAVNENDRLHNDIICASARIIPILTVARANSDPVPSPSARSGASRM